MMFAIKKAEKIIKIGLNTKYIKLLCCLVVEFYNFAALIIYIGSTSPQNAHVWVFNKNLQLQKY
jgi:hypothetical protein